MKKIVREKLNEIKRSEPAAKSIGVGSYRMMIDEIVEVLASVGCTHTDNTFDNVYEPDIIKEFDWMGKVFGINNSLIGMVTDYENTEVKICDAASSMLKIIEKYASIDKPKCVVFNDVKGEFYTAEKVEITANSVVAVLDETASDDEGDCFVFVNTNKILLPDDVSESQRHGRITGRINEIKRGGSERESIGVGYVGMIKNILSEVQIEHYNRGADRTTQDDEDSERINVMVQEIFSCESKDIDVVDLGEGPDATDVINRIRRYIYDENEVKGFSAWGVTYQIRWGKYFAVIVERSDVPGQENDPPYFHIALDNRHIRLY